MAPKEDPTYFIEFSPSAKAKCKKCMQSIEKGALRVGIKIEDSDKGYSAKHYNHTTCFKIPKHFGKISVKEFINTHLEDVTDGKVLPKHTAELIEAFETKNSSTSKSASHGGDEGNDSMIAHIKERYNIMQEENGEGNPSSAPPKKKAKKDDFPVPKKTSKDNEEEDVIPTTTILDVTAVKKLTNDELLVYQATLYGKYAKLKNDELKDILGYNRQVRTGTKDFILMKVLDGLTYGRLGRCTVCDGGRLKLVESDCKTIVCNGNFDESIQQRIPCSFTCTTATAPRKQPWYMEEPTEEEKEAMDKEESEARGEEDTSKAKSSSSGVVDELISLSKTEIKQWNLTNREGLRKAAEDIIALLQSKNAKITKSVDVPTDAKQAMQKVGQIISQNRTSTAAEIIPLVIDVFGYKEDKEEKENKKKSSIATSVKHPDNGPLVAVFQELGELYFKTGNRNAGASYVKVVKALSDLPFAVTSSNAKGLGSGKTKVPNIGKSSVDKILEFCETGTLEKLKEKRAEVA